MSARATWSMTRKREIVAGRFYFCLYGTFPNVAIAAGLASTEDKNGYTIHLRFSFDAYKTATKRELSEWWEKHEHEMGQK